MTLKIAAHGDSRDDAAPAGLAAEPGRCFLHPRSCLGLQSMEQIFHREVGHSAHTQHGNMLTWPCLLNTVCISQLAINQPQLPPVRPGQP